MKHRLFLALLGLACAAIATAAEPTPTAKKSDLWEPVRFLLGKWQGDSAGEPGKGKSVREYAFTLNNKFIELFEIAGPGKEFGKYSGAHFRRVNS